MRLIDADKLVPDAEWDDYDGGFISYSQLQIDSAPTIEQKKGKWEDLTYYNAIYRCKNRVIWLQMMEAKCSNCNLYADFERNRFDSLANYCPHCGADMRGEEDDTTNQL